MKNVQKYFQLMMATVCLLVLMISTIKADDKMKAEEIVAKHLESIGAKDKRSQITNLVVVADLQMKTLGNSPSFQGKSVIFSAGEKNLWGMNINSTDYPSDKFGFDGKSVKAAYIRPGVRSAIGSFLLTYDKLLKESFLGGVLTTSWVLNKYEAKEAKISFAGTSKIDGKEVYSINYSPKGGSDLDIKMHFDKSTFRHLRTEYKKVISAGLGSIDSSAGRGSQTYRIVEDFSDFKEVGGLTLPTSYKIFYSYFGGTTAQTSQSQSRDLEWTFKITNVSQNQKLEDSYFDIQGE